MGLTAQFLGLLAVIALIALVGAVVAFLASQSRRSRAHTELRSEGQPPLPSPPPPPPPLPPVPAAPAVSAMGPVLVTLTYTKVDGSTRERNLTLYSRNLRDGRTYSLNAREPGSSITKQFLLSGISRIVVQGENSPRVLTHADFIVSWLEQAIPLKADTSRDRARVAPGSSARPASPSVEPRGAATLAPPAPGMAFSDLLPQGAQGFAVLDLETTGLGRNCRIVEIALVRLDPTGRITEEWESLVHPGVTIPNADVHGIDDALVQSAPSFKDIAGSLAAKLHQHVLVAHNLRGFDGPILEAHFATVDGVDLHLGDGVDTMPTPRAKLVELCARHGVVLETDVAHTALGDTRALAKALKNGMAHLKPAKTAVSVQRNDRVHLPPLQLTRAVARATKHVTPWQPHSVQLGPGQVFITTGPASMKADTEIKRAEAHVTSLGLEYRKVSSIPKRNPPAFMITTSLDLSTRKMQDARERGIPVVLCRDVMQARQGATIPAWRYLGSGVTTDPG